LINHLMPTVIPYTTLFRSDGGARGRLKHAADDAGNLLADIVAIVHAERAAVLLADRENLKACQTVRAPAEVKAAERLKLVLQQIDRKRTRMNSSHSQISYA